MKKSIITLLAILCINVSANGQDTVVSISKDQLSRILKLLPAKDSVIKEAKTILPDSSQVTFSKVYSDAKAGIQGLAASLKVGAEHVYEVLVRQQIVNSITWLVCFVLSFILIVNFVKRHKDKSEDWFTSDFISGIGMLRILQFMASVIGFAISIFHVDKIIGGIINPEYGAIQDIINFVK